MPDLSWRKKNPDKAKAIAQRYYEKHKERLCEEQRVRRKEKPTTKRGTVESVQNTHLKYKYGITLEQYNIILNRQGKVCAICACQETALNSSGNVASLCVDHCHTTGNVRGLLCRNCNSALGKFKESKEILINAMTYLEEHGKTE